MVNNKPARHGLIWTEAAERAVYDAFRAGTPLADIAAGQGRTRGSVRGHLIKLGLLNEEGAPIDPPPAFTPTPAAQKRAAKASLTKAAKTRAQEIEPQTDINPRFAEALQLLHDTDTSIFLTGKAGTGKSTLLRHFRRHTNKNAVVLAPTGVAALNAGGQTIHHFFRLSVDVTPDKIATAKKIANPKIYRKLQTLIIDEISMVRADIMDCIDTFLRRHGPAPGQAFGGVQMVFIGDLYQLPPVVGSQERTIFETYYATPYFFAAHAMKNYPLRIIELEKVYRQKDDTFVGLLNRVRDNSVTEQDMTLLNSRVSTAEAPTTSFSIYLTGTNRRADEINAERLTALDGQTHQSTAQISGDFTRDYFPASPHLTWKTGAQIMLLTNDREGRWVNGSVGIIEATGKDPDKGAYVVVRLQDSDDPICIFRHSWEVFRYALSGDKIDSEQAGTFTQFPFRLAWAVTIHKSQGKTFTRVTIDLGAGAFAAGQVYVALSRCTSFEGITLKTPILRRHIRTDPRIEHFWREKSPAPLANPPPDWLVKILETAIRDKAALDILYRKVDDEQTRRTIYPRALSTARYKDENFLGLKALCAETQTEKLFDTARILQVGLRQI